MDGRRVVLAVYAIVVAISAVVGASVPVLLPAIGHPRLFGLFALPSTVVGYAAYAGVTTATLLGAGILLVEAASRTADG